MGMKELLNKLIEKGYIPFGRYGKLMTYGQDGGIKVFGFGVLGECEYSLRELVSKESGLWQFVCENEMVEEESCQYIEDKEICTSDEWICYYNDDGYPRDNYYTLDRTEAQFWIIESALKDESELEEFLLDNIKV